MFEVKTITSNKNLDCGASCLAMLLDYYGEQISQEDLAKELNIRLVGCSMKDMLRVARAHGLDPKPYKMVAEEVLRQDRPSIVWWRYDHFCVCCGMDEGRVLIINPDMGKYHMSRGMFASLYSGVALFNGEPQDLPEA